MVQLDRTCQPLYRFHCSYDAIPAISVVDIQTTSALVIDICQQTYPVTSNNGMLVKIFLQLKSKMFNTGDLFTSLNCISIYFCILLLKNTLFRSGGIWALYKK